LRKDRWLFANLRKLLPAESSRIGSDRRECLKVETVDRGMPKKQREDMLRALTESTARVVGADWAGAHEHNCTISLLSDEKKLRINPKLYA
jgi:hypothetical protein